MDGSRPRPEVGLGNVTRPIGDVERDGGTALAGCPIFTPFPTVTPEMISEAKLVGFNMRTGFRGAGHRRSAF
jgi:hypothetical protein